MRRRDAVRSLNAEEAAKRPSRSMRATQERFLSFEARARAKSRATPMLAKPTFLCAIVAVACAASGIASAQTFANRPIKVVVGFAPAGPAGVMARLIGQRLTLILGKSIVIGHR